MPDHTIARARPQALPIQSPTFAELYTPTLITILCEGYGFSDLRTDAIAGLTVAIVALPLSMAIAIASSGSPAQGLYTAIVGGILVSALGGSRFQIGGPGPGFHRAGRRARTSRRGSKAYCRAGGCAGVAWVCGSWLAGEAGAARCSLRARCKSRQRATLRLWSPTLVAKACPPVPSATK